RKATPSIQATEFEFATEPAGDMVLWDNWRAMHCATGTKPGVKRVINRTTIEGDVTLGRVLKTE
ncbi:MAG: TauD/TfdA family dioxygenase, partial [Colwellia sp.]